MAELADVKLTVTGAEADEAADGALTVTLPASPTTEIKFTATAEPAGATVTKWTWSKDGVVLEDQTTPQYTLQYTDQLAGEYIVKATPPTGEAKPSNVVKLTTATEGGATDSDGGGAGVVETSVGEFDPAFAYVTLAIFGAAIGAALILLNQNISLSLPKLTDVPKSGTYAERLRTYAVVAAVCAGVFALGVGTWLAALEVRGQLRKTVTVPADAGEETRGLTEEFSKILDSASKLRGTVAVLVAGVVLLLGALWSVGRASEPSGGTQTTTTSIGQPQGAGSNAGGSGATAAQPTP